MAGTDHTRTPAASAPDDMHWDLNYLREDIRDIRAEAREFRAETKAEFAEVRKEIDGVRQEVNEVRREMGAGEERLRAEMAELRESLLKRIDGRFYWGIGLMTTIMGVYTALTAALIKL